MKRLLVVAALGLSFVSISIAQDEAEYANWMKAVSATVASLRQSLEQKSAEAAAADARKLQDLFRQVHSFWEKRNVADAIKYALDASNAFGEAAEHAAAGKFDEATQAMRAAQTHCANCHSAHRERGPDGAWKIK